MKSFLKIYSDNLINLYKIWQKGNIDSLTNVYTYNALCEKIEQSKSFKNVGVAFIDANGLGLINNVYGHEEGDKMLKTIALITNKMFRQREIFRKGGDEFIILSANIPEEIFYQKINNIKKVLSITDYSASFGFVYAKETSNIEEQIRQADANMYEEKKVYKLKNPNKYVIK